MQFNCYITWTFHYRIRHIWVLNWFTIEMLTADAEKYFCTIEHLWRRFRKIKKKKSKLLFESFKKKFRVHLCSRIYLEIESQLKQSLMMCNTINVKNVMNLDWISLKFSRWKWFYYNYVRFDDKLKRTQSNLKLQSFSTIRVHIRIYLCSLKGCFLLGR